MGSIIDQPRSLDLTKLFVYFQLELTRVAVVHVAANTRRSSSSLITFLSTLSLLARFPSAGESQTYARKETVKLMQHSMYGNSRHFHFSSSSSSRTTSTCLRRPREHHRPPLPRRRQMRREVPAAAEEEEEDRWGKYEYFCWLGTT